MKTEVLNGLLTARTLLDTARMQCFVQDRHVASAGLIILQDALEIVLYSCLVEIGADEQKPLESFTFDQLIGELKALGFTLPKSGTLKAMNKQRILVKHYAQLAEPAAVRNYFDTAQSCADALLVQVVAKTLRDVVVADAIRDEALRVEIQAASSAVDAGEFGHAMIATRKALFLSIESDYDVGAFMYGDGNDMMHKGLFGKAPYDKRNRAWVEANVNEPTQYVQYDYERIRIELMEDGIDSVDFFNVLRLTPPVSRLKSGEWVVKETPDFEAATSENNARYCLDVVVSILMKQQLRFGRVRREVNSKRWTGILNIDHPLLKKASLTSTQGVILPKGTECNVDSIVFALDGKDKFVCVHTADAFGFLPLGVCQILR